MHNETSIKIESNGSTIIAVGKCENAKRVQGNIMILMTKGVLFGFEILELGKFLLFPSDGYDASEVRAELEILNTAYNC